MQRLQVAVLYFLLVFSAGFVLGTLRVLFVEPAIGARLAELLEIPLMLVVVLAAARWITARRTAGIRGPAQWLQVGLIALALMLAADVSVGVALRGMTVRDALFARDPLSGAAYYLALGVLAVAPWWSARRASPSQSGGR